MHKNEKYLILGIIVSLLIGVIGYSFSYFVSSVTVSGSGSSTNLTTADLIDVEYDAGSSALSLTNALPGSSASKTFNVNITPTTDDNTAKYAITLNIDSNTFTKCTASTSTNACSVNESELTVTLKRTIDGGSSTTLASNVDLTGVAGSKVLYTENLSFSDTTKHVYAYTVEISFVNTGYEQNHNMNKSLSGSISVAFTS